MSNQLALYGKQVLQMLNCAVRRKSNRSPPNLFFNSMQHSQFDLKLSYNVISDPRFSRASDHCVSCPTSISHRICWDSAQQYIMQRLPSQCYQNTLLFFFYSSSLCGHFSLFLSRTSSARDIHSS